MDKFTVALVLVAVLWNVRAIPVPAQSEGTNGTTGSEEVGQITEAHGQGDRDMNYGNQQAVTDGSQNSDEAPSTPNTTPLQFPHFPGHGQICMPGCSEGDAICCWGPNDKPLNPL
ncbi:uncharacterized protein [Periplaneta americana]|uniref:uncharacterized protein n=1 Tax=Periplaneta americana TaxID=6978 RepID=UPI0037E7E685